MKFFKNMIALTGVTLSASLTSCTSTSGNAATGSNSVTPQLPIAPPSPTDPFFNRNNSPSSSKYTDTYAAPPKF